MHQALEIYLTFWRTNTIAAALWHGVLLGAILAAVHDSKIRSREAKLAR